MCERELQCRECGKTKWSDDEFASNLCDSCGGEMDLLQRDRCNACGRELQGREEHEMGLCAVCS
jgi:hypothetical protein